MKRSLGFLLLVLMVLPATAQRFSQRKRPDIIPLEGQARRGGFYVSPGLTYTLTRGKNPEEEVFRAGDTSYTAVYDPNGRPGLYLEAGWFYLTRNPVILDYWDFGLAYKNLRGNELYTGVLARGDSAWPLPGKGSSLNNS
ncbi:MAG: hypothetical protein IPI91_09775 [Flavobacteriales bacterium]|nr:hypothetical protein [Flavobacteriales bacterium]